MFAESGAIAKGFAFHGDAFEFEEEALAGRESVCRNSGRRRYSNGLFPLTPALSLGEREPGGRED